MSRAFSPHPKDVLLVIDMQQDFLPRAAGYEGALGVAGGDALIAPIEDLARRFDHVILTADWHPRRHISFAPTHGRQPFETVLSAYGEQSLWPEHCVQGTRGAEIAVDIPHAELVLRKGFRPSMDSYSAFLENDHLTPTGLGGYLRERQLQRLFFAGLAYDYCVGSSAVDGVRLGFDCFLIEDLTRAVDQGGSVASMRARLEEHRVATLRVEDILR